MRRRFTDFGELDLANALRQLDARAHRRPARLAVLPLVARGRALGRLAELLARASPRRSRALRTASICFCTCRDRSAMRSSVISSSLKITSSRIVRSPVCSWSPSWMTFLATSGVREIDLMTASLPRSMRRAISTSPSRVSSGTVPISRRYMRTGSLVLSSAPGVRSSSSSSEPSAVRSMVFSSRRYFWSESMTSMPALPNVLNRSSSSSEEVISDGSSSFTSSYSR